MRDSKPVGGEGCIELNAGDLYISSEKAVGTDWKKKSIITLRHAAGKESCAYARSTQITSVTKGKEPDVVVLKPSAMDGATSTAGAAFNSAPPSSTREGFDSCNRMIGCMLPHGHAGDCSYQTSSPSRNSPRRDFRALNGGRKRRLPDADGAGAAAAAASSRLQLPPGDSSQAGSRGA